MASEIIQGRAVIAASSNSGVITLKTSTMGQVAVELYGVTGSGSPNLDLFIEGKAASGRWFEVPADQVLKSSGAAAGNSVTLNVRDIVDAHTSGAAQFVGIYKHLPAGSYRVRWIISGTFTAGQGFDVEASFDAK